MNYISRFLLSAILICQFYSDSYAQIINSVETWGTGGNGTASCSSSSSRHMGSNYHYTCGTFSGAVDLDPTSGVQAVSSTGNSGFITGYHAISGHLWGITMDNARPVKIIHTVNAIYVAGSFSGISSFSGTTSYMSNGQDDVFLMKVSFTGNVDWVKTFGGTGNDLCTSMEIGTSASPNASDVVYLTGTFQNTVDFNPSTAVNLGTSNGGNDCFVVKIYEDGSFGWFRAFGGSGDDQARDIDVLDNSIIDDIHIIGDFNGLVDFNPTQGTYYMSTGTSLSKAIFILKLTESGGFSWVKKLDNVNSNGGFPTFGYTIASFDVDGSLYCGGVFESSVPFDFDPSNTSQHLVTGTSAASNAFLLKLNSLGQFEWVRNFAPSATEVVPHDIDVVTDGVYTIGYFLGQANFNLSNDPVAVLYSSTSNCFITRHKTNGDFKWAKQPEPGPGQTGASILGKHSLEAFEHGGFSRIWFTGAFGSSVVDMDPELSDELLYNNNSSVGSFDGFVTQWGEDLFLKGARKSLVNAENESNLFPNPTNGIVNIELDNENLSSIEILNSQGEIIDAEIYNEGGMTYIDLSNQVLGIYFIKYMFKGEPQVERVSLID